MQNVVQNSTTESVGNCVKHEVGHRANPAAPTSAACAKPSSNSHCNSVPKTNHNTSKVGLSAPAQACLSSFGRKAVAVTELPSSNSSVLATELALQQVKRSRSYHQYMSDNSDSDSDDVLSVSCLAG